jgi:hypothetical protein
LFLFFGAFALLVDGHEVDLFAQGCKLLAAAVVAFVRGEFLGVSRRVRSPEMCP